MDIKRKQVVSCCWLGLIFLLLVSSASANSQSSINKKMKEINFQSISVENAARVLSNLSGVNIIVTPDAGDTRFSMYLTHISVKNAIDSLCRINNLWYRYNRETDVFLIMTVEEYSKELVVFRNEKTKIFTLQYQNLNQIANSIEALFGEERVQLTLDDSAGDNFSLEALDDLLSSDSTGDSNGSTGGGFDDGDNVFVQGLNERGNVLSTEQLKRLLDFKSANAMIDADKVEEIAQRDKATIFVTVNLQQNMLLVRTGDAQAMEEISRIVKETDLPIAQVLLEMKVLSIDVSDDYHWDFDLSLVDGSNKGGPADGISDNNPLSGGSGLAPSSILGLGDLTSMPTPNTLIFQHLNDNIRARLKWLQENGKINVLSTPMLLSANNRASRLFVGEEAIITTGFTGGSTTVGNNVSVNSALRPETEVRPIGNSLLILPSINKDRTVLMRVVLDNSTLKKGGGSIPVVTGSQLFDVKVDTVETSVLEGIALAGDGMTVAFGGMFTEIHSESESKVPVLGDLPFLGQLFTSISQTKKKKELVLLITPHVFTSAEEAETRSGERINELSIGSSSFGVLLEKPDQ